MKSIAKLMIVLMLTASTTSRTFAGAAAGGASEPTQILNNIQLILSYGKQAEEVSKSIQQIQNQVLQYQQLVAQTQDMVNNTLALPSHIWGDAQAALTQLANVVQTGQAIAYSMGNVDTEFQNKFQSYDDHLVRDYNRANFGAEYREWSNTNRDSIRGALLSANLQADQFATENSTLAQIQTLSQSSTGRLQAIQAGSMIAAQQVRQIQKLRQLVMAQIQLSAAAEASIQEEKDRNQAINDNYYQAPITVTPTDGTRY
mgnify:CR=1 FL=1